MSVFTVEEALSGWYGLLRRAKNDTELLTVYRRLEETIPVLARFPLLTLSASALDEYNRLRALKLNIGPMDLRIAGIVLANDATLVTRNRRDFSRVPGLQFEDWTEIV
ncbi:MAG: type II toxin-antitoxin system VapC family toxin [Akkermansiaceae bacterium]|nr:type II toxin-antitoxin system VapC family toxin [Armatimonadota bacterium]